MSRFLTTVVLALLAAGVAAVEPENRPQTDALRKHMKENYGMPGFETSWYGNIVTLSIQGKKVVVKTKISSKNPDVGKETAKKICSAVSGHVYSKENRGLGVEHIQVLGSDGTVMASRHGASGACDLR